VAATTRPRLVESSDDGKPANEFGDQAIFQEILGLDLAEDFPGTAVLQRNNLGAETNRA
jgi:hypothetical protein